MTDREGGPLRTGLFEVYIDDVLIEGWRSITLPGISIEEGGYKEGDDGEEKRVWGDHSYDDLQMERGVIPGDSRLYDWAQQAVQGQVDQGRKQIAVKLLDEEGKDRVEWQFFEAWVKDYDPPDLDASADGDIATESCTVAFDSMRREEVQEGPV